MAFQSSKCVYSKYIKYLLFTCLSSSGTICFRSSGTIEKTTDAAKSIAKSAAFFYFSASFVVGCGSMFFIDPTNRGMEARRYVRSALTRQLVPPHVMARPGEMRRGTWHSTCRTRWAPACASQRGTKHWSGSKWLAGASGRTMPLVEKLSRSLKFGWGCLYAFEAGSEHRAGLGPQITYYTNRRPHPGLAERTPVVECRRSGQVPHDLMSKQAA